MLSSKQSLSSKKSSNDCPCELVRFANNDKINMTPNVYKNELVIIENAKDVNSDFYGKDSSALDYKKMSIKQSLRMRKSYKSDTNSYNSPNSMKFQSNIK
jgi:hypothetical protein